MTVNVVTTEAVTRHDVRVCYVFTIADVTRHEDNTCNHVPWLYVTKYTFKQVTP